MTPSPFPPDRSESARVKKFWPELCGCRNEFPDSPEPESVGPVAKQFSDGSVNVIFSLKSSYTLSS